MKRFLLVLAASFAVISGGQAQQPKAKPVKILFHHHSFFEIQSSKGTTIIIDPHALEAYGPPKKIMADIVLMTHQHPDHTYTKVNQNPAAEIIPGFVGQGAAAKWNLFDRKIKDVRIRSLGTYHDEERGLKYGINTIFIIEVDGWRIAHLGDLGHPLSSKQIKQIGPVDVVMVPVGGIYSLNGSQAYDVVRKLKPKEYIFPMHYATPVFDEVLTPEEFLENFTSRQIAYDKGNSVELNRDPQRPRPLVVMLLTKDKK